ncbi:cytochrome c oxidase assembly protein subunit 15 [Aquiflexum balticum DSM 16537]|uniref:Cytochrome c oxidase assembly protein subunit 15 n=1 Tax=Aquiflexum balticum DSM 16537 TaxID=758820 RepID=A0A1W2HAV0_9BACT|nr:COX15/CtaA family protein [Aquiflexum balticum]SMD45997.1 cytochrome c oxidase assembly protein subunit 15 [Aquiflexum balticum DSM 16537]
MRLGSLNPKLIYQNAVHTWLMAGVILVLLMVVIGGVTRLTQSGLSMVRWEPIIGAIPPTTAEQWQQEFVEYQASPEFKAYNSHFTLSDYKQIYFWEYLHRLIGRMVGLVFIFPAMFFWVKGVFDLRMKKQVMLIFLGGLFQGFLGWYMVKSGLVDMPHVSHYRLTAHLSTALALAAYIYWLSLEWKIFTRIEAPTIKKGTIALTVLLGIQIIYGGLVAGLKAGKMYNTFPKMGRTWFPSDLNTALDLHGVFSLFANGVVVQFIHRYLAYLVIGGVILLWWRIKKNASELRPLGDYLLIMVGIQFFLGVLTLIWAVPVSLGLLHQMGAVVLLLGLVKMVKKTAYINH